MNLFRTLFGGLLRSAENSAVTGVTTGLHYVHQAQQIMLWAIATNNAEAIGEAVEVAVKWGEETFGLHDTLLPDVEEAIRAYVSGDTPKVDPWASSRAMTQALWAKWAIAAGLAAPTAPTTVTR
jgi:hypothetical protein